MTMIHDITSAAPRNKRSQRKGRGEGSGRGKTSGKGTKGSKARVGKYIKRGYEGGQTPLFRRWPKRGFSNDDFERRFCAVNLSLLERRFDDGATVDTAALILAGLIADDKLPLKILGDGALTKKLTVVAAWYSRSAHKKIADAGGSALNLKNEPFEFPKPKKKFIPREKVKKVVEAAPADAVASAASPPPATAAAASKPDEKPVEAEKPAAE